MNRTTAPTPRRTDAITNLDRAVLAVAVWLAVGVLVTVVVVAVLPSAVLAVAVWLAATASNHQLTPAGWHGVLDAQSATRSTVRGRLHTVLDGIRK